MLNNLHFAKSIYDGYENYKQQKLSSRRFKHSDILPLIEQLKNKEIFKLKKVGESIEKREIFLISIGSGSKKIFCWSQMHGDESTATAAIFDIINFFLAESHYADFKKHLLSTVTLYFLPMLNPDGAELFQRRNIIEIDLNRDAKLKQSPESKILTSVFDEIKPAFAFNLHDQDRIYSVGKYGKATTLSFLAPAYDAEKSSNEWRSNSMKLIGRLYLILSEFIPGHIAKYQDDFEPRAFGDTFAKSLTSIVLIESGGWHNDREKLFIRKLNFISLLTSFKCIAEESYREEPIETYLSIPENEKLMMDFIIRKVTVVRDENEYILDIGINYDEINIDQNRSFYYQGKIEDIGDLSIYSGYKELNAEGLTLELGKTYEKDFKSLDELKDLDTSSLIEQGFTNVRLNSPDVNLTHSLFLFNIVAGNNERTELLKGAEIPNFVLKKDGIIKWAVINGFPIELKNISRHEGNALILR